MLRKYIFTIFVLLVTIALGACTQSPASGGNATSNTNSSPSTGAVIGSAKAGDTTVTLSNSAGHLSAGNNDFTVEFKNAAGHPIDVGAVTMFIDMPGMGAMPPMKSNVKLMTTNTPGIYQATTNLEMAGTWYANVSYKGNAGEGKAKFAINAK